MIALSTFSWVTGASGADSLVLSADTSGLKADTQLQNCTQEKMNKKKPNKQTKNKTKHSDVEYIKLPPD